MNWHMKFKYKQFQQRCEQTIEMSVIIKSEHNIHNVSICIINLSFLSEEKNVFLSYNG